MKFLVINSSNYVPNSNNTFEYNFPSSVKFKEGDKIAVSSVSMFNSIFNIEPTRNNNTLQLIINYATPVTLNVIIPAGFYAPADLQTYLQSVCYVNGYYLTASTGNIIYPFEMSVNLIAYEIQFVCNVTPTSTQATNLGYSAPAGVSWSFPSTAQCSQVVILNNNFTKIVGINPGTYPSTPITTQYTFASSFPAVINPVSTLMLLTNFICNSAYSYPMNVFHSIPITTGFASAIELQSPNLIFQDIQPATYQQMIISFTDQLFNPIVLHDYTVTISLVIKLANEN